MTSAQVDLNRLKGNYAQAIAASWLSRMCLVRPVAEGTDIGVDLYCESVVEGQPFLHFWVQVKAIPTSNIQFIEDKPSASYRFERKHLEYWDRQPIPVYALLVPLDQWPPSHPERIFGVRITENLVRSGTPETASVTFRTSSSFDAESLDDDLYQFVTKVVPWDTSAILLKKGIVVPLPNTDPESENSFPIGIGYQYLQKILNTIRDASVHGPYHSLMAEYANPDWQRVRKSFETIAQLFENQMYNTGLSMLVRTADFDGDTEKAKGYIHRALRRIAQDKTLSEPEKRAQSSKVRMLLEDFK